MVACASLKLQRERPPSVQASRVLCAVKGSGGEVAHALAISFDRVGPDDEELALVQLDDVLLGRVAEDVFPHISEHKHGE